jgi:diphthamide synthase (EF-2-diphthine--ammonia ligase)
MIDAGLESYLVCVDLGRLPRQFAGRRFDHALLADLPAAVDPCGERGEYHTCVVAGPMFSRRIDVTVGATIEQDGYAYTDLIPGRTSGSAAQHPAGAL